MKIDKQSAAEVGRLVRGWRIQRGITQGALAKAIGVTYQQVHKWEAGQNRMSCDRMRGVVQALGLDPAEVGRVLFANGYVPPLSEDTRADLIGASTLASLPRPLKLAFNNLLSRLAEQETHDAKSE